MRLLTMNELSHVVVPLLCVVPSVSGRTRLQFSPRRDFEDVTWSMATNKNFVAHLLPTSRSTPREFPSDTMIASVCGQSVRKIRRCCDARQTALLPVPMERLV